MTNSYSFPKPSLDPYIKDRSREEELKQQTFVDPDAAWAQHAKDAIAANNEFAKQMYKSMTAARSARDKTISDFSTLVPKIAGIAKEFKAARERHEAKEVIFEEGDYKEGSISDQTMNTILGKDNSNQTEINKDNATTLYGSTAAANALSKGDTQEAIGLLEAVSEMKTQAEIADFFANQETINGIFKVFMNIGLPVEVNGKTEIRYLGDTENSLDVHNKLVNRVLASYLGNLEDSGTLKKRYINRVVLPELLKIKKASSLNKSIQITNEVAERTAAIQAEVLVDGIKKGDSNNYLLDIITSGDDGKGKKGLMYMLNSLKDPIVKGDITLEQVMPQLEKSAQYKRNDKTGTLYEVYKDEVDNWKAEVIKERDTKQKEQIELNYSAGTGFTAKLVPEIDEFRKSGDGEVPVDWILKNEAELLTLEKNNQIDKEMFNVAQNMLAKARLTKDDVKSRVQLTELLQKSRDGEFIFYEDLSILNTTDKNTFTEQHGTAVLSRKVFQLVDARGMIEKSYRPYLVGNLAKGTRLVKDSHQDFAIRVALNEVAKEFKEFKKNNPNASDRMLMEMAIGEWVKDFESLDSDKAFEKILKDSAIFDSGRTTDQNLTRQIEIIDLEKQIPNNPSLLLSDKRIAGEDDRTDRQLKNYLKGNASLPRIYGRYGTAGNFDGRNVAITRAYQLGFIDEKEANELAETGKFFKTQLGEKLYKEITRNPYSGTIFEYSEGGERLNFAAEAFVPKRVLESGNQFDYTVGVELDQKLTTMTLGQVKKLVDDGKLTEVGIFGLDKEELKWALGREVLNISEEDFRNNQLFDEDFQRRLPGLVMKYKCKDKQRQTGTEIPKTCNAIELNFRSDIEENEVILQVLNKSGGVDTTHFSNQPTNLSAGLVEFLMKELQD